MSEVQDCEHVFIYYAKCPICSRLFAGLSRHQLLQNLIQHGKKHDSDLKVGDVDVKSKRVDLCRD
ncbi:MAG: hypothetical protein QXO22_06580 [Thermosphaera sp.]